MRHGRPSAHGRLGCATGRADRAQQRIGLDPRLGDLRLRDRSPRRRRRRPRGGCAPRRSRTCGSSAPGRGRRCRRRGRALPSTRHGRPARARAIRSTAAIFGAPVIDPPGNVARRSSARPTPSRSVPSTVETMCSTPASARVAISSGQRTLPGSQTRERSLRSRSTIITCSAASFAEPASSPAAARRARSLDRARPDAAAAPREEELGRAGDDRPAVAAIGLSDCVGSGLRAGRRARPGRP